MTVAGFRTLWLASASILACAASPQEQAGVTEHGLAFEVVSVKPSLPENRGIIMIRPEPGGQRYVARSASLRLMMQAMYQIANAQIANAPGWMETELYDVEAKAERPATMDLEVLEPLDLRRHVSQMLELRRREEPVFAFE